MSESRFSRNSRTRLVSLCVAAVAAAGTMAATATGAVAAPQHLGNLVGSPTVGHAFPATSRAAANAAPAAAPEGAHFVSMAPTRSFDTRTNGMGPLRGHTILPLDYPKGTLDPRVTAITFNLTVTDTTQDTYVTVWSGQGPVPNASSINVRAGETRANQVIVPIVRDSDGTAHIYIYNNAGSADVITDIAGAYGTGEPDDGQKYTGYVPQTPARVLDTRTTGGPLGGGTTRTLDLSGVVPDDADSVTVNLTAISHTAGGYLTLYPGGTRRGNVSSINVQAGETTPNQVTVQLGEDKTLNVFNSAGSTDAVIDLEGVFVTGDEGALYYPTTVPRRVLDTRDGTGVPKGALGPQESVQLDLPVQDKDNTVAVNANLTGIAGDAATYLTDWPSGDRPLASNLNLTAGQTAANATAAGIDGGSLEIYNNAGDTDAVLDVSGFYLRQ